MLSLRRINDITGFFYGSFLYSICLAPLPTGKVTLVGSDNRDDNKEREKRIKIINEVSSGGTGTEAYREKAVTKEMCPASIRELNCLLVLFVYTLHGREGRCGSHKLTSSSQRMLLWKRHCR